MLPMNQSLSYSNLFRKCHTYQTKRWFFTELWATKLYNVEENIVNYNFEKQTIHEYLWSTLKSRQTDVSMQYGCCEYLLSAHESQLKGQCATLVDHTHSLVLVAMPMPLYTICLIQP